MLHLIVSKIVSFGSLAAILAAILDFDDNEFGS